MVKVGWWCHLKYHPLRNAGHSRESGNPVREQRISPGFQSGFAFAGMTAARSAPVWQMTPLPKVG
jgi:hypothetical protein